MTRSFDLSEPSEAARARVMDLTLGVVRRRRIRRRFAAVLFVVAAYGAGFVTPRPGVSSASASPPRGEVAPAPPVARPSPVDPGDLESRAALASAQDEREVLLKLAGDRYLSDRGDVEAALRCYRQLLKLSSSVEHNRFDPADTWLLAALKRSSD